MNIKGFSAGSILPLSLLATGAIAIVSPVPQAHAFDISGPAGGIYTVSNLQEGDAFDLSWSLDRPNTTNDLKAVGYLWISALSANSATVNVRIDNLTPTGTFQPRITSFGLGVDPNVNISSYSSQNGFLPNSGTTPPAFPSFSSVEICGASGNCAGGGNGGISSLNWDVIQFVLSPTGVGSFANGLTLNSFALKFQTSEGSFEVAGTPTRIPTPALLPGLVAFGLGALRKKQKQEAETKKAELV